MRKRSENLLNNRFLKEIQTEQRRAQSVGYRTEEYPYWLRKKATTKNEQSKAFQRRWYPER